MSEAADLGPISLRAAATEENNQTFMTVREAIPISRSVSLPAPQSTLAIRDIIDGALAWRMWGLLGWLDIRQRYRRSKIGPFWITISMGAMIAGMGVFYPTLFHTSAPQYLPYITLGFIGWGLISGVITDNCNAFIGAEGVIKQIKLPLALYVFRVVWRNLILFAHNLVIYVLVAAWFRVWPSWSMLLVIPGLALLFLNAVSTGLFLGTVCARFRDVPQIVASVLQIFFFLTPIFWKPESLSRHSFLLDLNPFYYFVQLIRGPLLGEPPSALIWLGTLLMTLTGWAIAFFAYRLLRRRIAYWL